MTKRLLFILLKTTLVSLPISLLLLYIYFKNTSVSLYNAKEYLEVYTGLFYLATSVKIIGMAVLSLTCLLNVNEVIRNNYWYSFASFFLLVLCFSIIGAFSIDRLEAFIVFLLLKIPFIGILFFHFIRFRKNIKPPPLRQEPY